MVNCVLYSLLQEKKNKSKKSVRNLEEKKKCPAHSVWRCSLGSYSVRALGFYLCVSCSGWQERLRELGQGSAEKPFTC